MSCVGILTFSDGRGFVHKAVVGLAADVEQRIAAACEAFGAEVVRGTEIITANGAAVRGARQLVYDDDKNEALMRQSNYVWPHAFTRTETHPPTPSCPGSEQTTSTRSPVT
jgi:L-fucose isomerase